MKLSFDQAVRLIREKDRRFDVDAFSFLRDSLDFTVKNSAAKSPGPTSTVVNCCWGFVTMP
ncbi:MAG: hypothetical protein R3F31_24915 [Verrucomicrobiales bacterium]